MTTKLSSSYDPYSNNQPRLTEIKTALTPAPEQLKTNQKAKNAFHQAVSSTSPVSTIQLNGANAPATTSKTNDTKELETGLFIYQVFEMEMQSAKLENPFTNPKDIALLISIFDALAKAPVDTLPYFILDSINLEWSKIAKDVLQSNPILKGYISNFNDSFFRFNQEIQQQEGIIATCEPRELHDAKNNKNNIKIKYQEDLKKRINLLEKNLSSGSSIIHKHRLLLVLMSSPVWDKILHLNIRDKLPELVYKSERQNQKLNNNKGTTKKPLYTAYNQKSNMEYFREDVRLGSDLITLPINHLRSLIDYYEKSTPEELQKLITELQTQQPKLQIQQPHPFLASLVKDLSEFQDSTPVKKEQIAKEIIKKIETTTSLIEKKSVLLDRVKEFNGIKKDLPENRLTRVNKILVLDFYFGVLAYLKNYLKNGSFQQDLLYTSIRTYDNIDSLVTLNEKMFNEELQPSLKIFLKEIKGFHFYKELNAFFRDHQGFDMSSTGPTMELLLQDMAPPSPKALNTRALLFSLKNFQIKASKRAEELQAAGKQDEAKKLAKDYTEACYLTLMPLFLISHDIKNMNHNNSSDPKELLIPEEIFDFINLELNTPEIEPIINNEAREKLEPPPVEPAPPQAPSKTKQKKATPPTKIVKVTKVVSEPNDVRELKPGRNETAIEWGLRIEKLGLKMVHGSRHMHVKGPDGTLVTTFSLGNGGNKTVPKGTALNMGKQVKAYLSNQQQKKKK